MCARALALVYVHALLATIILLAHAHNIVVVAESELKVQAGRASNWAHIHAELRLCCAGNAKKRM